MKKYYLLAGAALGIMAMPVHAQEAANGAVAQEAEGGLEDIVVTAQRRSERLQNVPIAITVAGAEQLSIARVDNIANIQSLSPSVQFRTSNLSSSSANVIIRGLGTTGNSRAFEGAVGIFIDGVYRTRAAAALQTFNDIDNVQILRGPQGTLFGKNTSAGAILLSSVKPDLTGFGGNYEGSYGDYGYGLAKLAVNAPLSETVALRVAGVYSHRDGYFTDSTTGEPINGDESYGVKAQLYFEPSSTLSFRLVGDYLKSNANCCYGTKDYIDGPTQPLIDSLVRASGLKVPSKNVNDMEASLNLPTRQRTEDYGAAFHATLGLGNDELKSVTAYREFSVTQLGLDADFTGADLLILDESFKSKFFSQELTFNGKAAGGALSYVMGAFFSHEKLEMARGLSYGKQAQAFWDVVFKSPGYAIAEPGLYQTDDMGGTSKSYAVFAHADYQFAPAWNVIAGLRYSIEEKNGYFSNPFFRAESKIPARRLGSGPGPAYNADMTDKAVSGTLGLQYRPAANAMIYLTYNRGFKAGGVAIDANGAGARANNPAEIVGAKPLDPRYKPETVNAFELGAKLDYLGNRARTNIAVFYTDISNFQVAQFLGLQFAVLNSKSAESYGLEMENTFKIGDALTLSASGLWLPKADYGVDPSMAAVLSGQRFRYAPKLSGNVALNFQQPINDDLELTSRAQFEYSGAQFLSTSSTTKRGGVGTLNLNVGIKSESGGWNLEGWVQNFFDERYATYGFSTPLQTGDQNAYYAPPRTIGVTLRGKF